jgi:hypothetical protein
LALYFLFWHCISFSALLVNENRPLIGQIAFVIFQILLENYCKKS